MLARFRYYSGMTDHDLLRIAHKAELRASRAAAPSGVSEQAALRQLLTRKAGVAGLAALVAERCALLDAAEARQLAAAARTEAQQRQRTQVKPTAWRAWFDGSAHPNPGRCGIGVLVTGPGGERIELSQPAGYGNSSEAEYSALIAALGAAIDAGARALTAYGDSKVVIDDVNGVAAPSKQLSAYRTQARALMKRFDDVLVRWLPRHKNAEADALSQGAVQQVPDAGSADKAS